MINATMCFLRNNGNWISDSNLADIRMYQGDRRILELISQEGVFEVVTQYDKEELVRFESQRVF